MNIVWATLNIINYPGSIHFQRRLGSSLLIKGRMFLSFDYLYSVQNPICVPYRSSLSRQNFYRISSLSPSLMASGVKEARPPTLGPDSEFPADVFDGTTKLFIAYLCPFAQRVWITRNYKGLQDKIKLIAVDLFNLPAWYKEKVYPPNKVPALVHNNEVKGESLDLIRYLSENFEGLSLLPEDPAKREFAEKLFSYSDSFNGAVFSAYRGGGVGEVGAALDYLENALGKFDDGPFFLGTFSLVDIVYAPFIERFQLFALDMVKYDVTEGRPKLAAWIEEINKIEAYKVTKVDPEEFLAMFKKRTAA